MLGHGFYKLVTIESAHGLDDRGEFDHDNHFLPYMKQALFAAFGVEATDEFHPEQIVQLLKELPPLTVLLSRRAVQFQSLIFKDFGASPRSSTEYFYVSCPPL